MTRWIIDKEIKEQAPNAVEWAKGYLGQHDLSDLDWVRIDFGRQRDNGRAPQGVYGRCWYPIGRGRNRKGFRISCQVPGPYPFTISTRKSPAYVDVTRHYGPRPDVPTEAIAEIGSEGGRDFWDVAYPPDLGADETLGDFVSRNGKAWYRIQGRTTVLNLCEGIAWIVGHEAFHFLRRSRQVPGINNEIQADAAGDAALADYRAAK